MSCPPHTTLCVAGASGLVGSQIVEEALARGFDAALEGADAVFVACFPPIYRGRPGAPASALSRARGHGEIVRPVEQGCLRVLGAARRQRWGPRCRAPDGR